MSGRLGESDPIDGQLSLVEAARHLEMSVHTVGRWASCGRIPSAIAPGGTWIFRIQDVENVSVHRIEPGEVTSAE